MRLEAVERERQPPQVDDEALVELPCLRRHLLLRRVQQERRAAWAGAGLADDPAPRHRQQLAGPQ
eukprot:8896514-Lingulodinium_polyedra.AAC.1